MTEFNISSYLDLDDEKNFQYESNKKAMKMWHNVCRGYFNDELSVSSDQMIQNEPNEKNYKMRDSVQFTVIVPASIHAPYNDFNKHSLKSNNIIHRKIVITPVDHKKIKDYLYDPIIPRSKRYSRNYFSEHVMKPYSTKPRKLIQTPFKIPYHMDETIPRQKSRYNYFDHTIKQKCTKVRNAFTRLVKNDKVIAFNSFNSQQNPQEFTKCKNNGYNSESSDDEMSVRTNRRLQTDK